MVLRNVAQPSVAAQNAPVRGCIGMRLVMVNDTPVSKPADVTKYSELFPVMSLRFVPETGSAADPAAMVAGLAAYCGFATTR